MKPSPPPPAHTVAVRDARRLLESAQVHRQRQFQRLVRHFLSQILHGCKSAYCSTPTCLSSTRRNPSKPLRPPTHLTACALAHHLASQDDPYHALCPHELKVAPTAIEIDGALGAALRPGSSSEARQYAVYPAPSSLDARNADGHDTQHTLVDTLNKRRQAKKDVKSLGQNLYDSATVIYSYSKQIPSPLSVLATLRAPDDQARSPALANGQPVTARASHGCSLARQPSQEDLRAQSHADSTSAPPKSSSPEHVHRIPYHPPVTHRPSSLDNTTESPRLSITKTGRKSFTLGGSIPPMPRPSPPPVAEKHGSKDARPPTASGQSVLVTPTLSCEVLDQLKTQVHHHRRNQSTDFNFVVDYDSNRHFRPAKPFVNRSLFYTLSDTETLLQSFHDHSESFKDSPLPHLDSARLTHSFRDWNQRNGALIFDALWAVVEALFTPPPELSKQKDSRSKYSRKHVSIDGSQKSSKQADGKPRYLSDQEAAHVVMVCIHALTSLVPVGWAHTWSQLRKLRSWGVVVPNATPNSDDYADPYLNIIDELEYEPALRLTDRLLRGIGTRNCFEHILAAMNSKDREGAPAVPSFTDIVFKHLEVAEQAALANKRRMSVRPKPSDDPGWTITATFMEWLRTTIIKQWDSKVELNRWSNVGTAVRLLDKLYHRRHKLNLRPNMFVMPFFNERINITDEPMKFLDWKEQPNTLHIFQYPHLFPVEYLVAYFRTINLTSMMAQYDHTQRVYQMKRTLEVILKEPYSYIIKNHLRITLQDYLVLNVSREEPLTDTLDQIWGQQKKMLLKPLKVKMGEHEGEVGLDHGGVSSEFFRVVLSEAFRPDNGMFTLDAQSRMMWFQPGTLEPLWRFELLGVLFSLAVYNGITLPVTFPLALYRYLLQPHTEHPESQGLVREEWDMYRCFLQPDSMYPENDEEHDLIRDGWVMYCDLLQQDNAGVECIRDGWPSLAKSFEELLSWSDGDVGDVIMRDYAFSFEVFGQMVDHDMRSPLPRHKSSSPTVLEEPSISSAELPLVTNANRADFVRDYIMHLTYISVAPQLRAFRKGFMTCLHPRSLLLFTPTTLRRLIEGTQHISIPSLRECTRYEEPYSATHPAILNFWSIVSEYSQDDCRALLEFVTASDRVPITGYESITFHIVPLNGDTENLPTSSTCFGKLYLPEYSAREKMEAKLGLAIRNSTGFGVI